MNRVYNIKVDLTQNIDDFPNVHKINISDYPDISQILASEKYNLDESVIFARANLKQICKYDYLSNDLNIPILHKRFIQLIDIEKLDAVSCVPIKLIDDTYLDSIYDDQRNFKEDVPQSKDFFSLKFHRQFDFCDIEKSSFRKLRSKPNALGIIKNVVLKSPPNGFPVIFRIKETINKLFITHKLFQIIQDNNIKGCVFEPIEVS